MTDNPSAEDAGASHERSSSQCTRLVEGGYDADYAWLQHRHPNVRIKTLDAIIARCGPFHDLPKHDERALRVDP